MDESALRYDAELIVTEELEALKRRIINNHIAAGQRTTGATAESMSVAVESDGDSLVGALDARGHFAALETGTRPWQNPYYRTTKDGRQLPAPPRWWRNIVGEWLTAKGLDMSPWLVAGKIMTEGSRLYREGGRDDIYSNEIPTAVKNISERLAGLFEAQLITSILRTTENQ